jgi:hypothetical protein
MEADAGDGRRLGELLTVNAVVRLGSGDPSEFCVEVYLGSVDSRGDIELPGSWPWSWSRARKMGSIGSEGPFQMSTEL